LCQADPLTAMSSPIQNPVRHVRKNPDNVGVLPDAIGIFKVTSIPVKT
jgi:hypothetical protein